MKSNPTEVYFTRLAKEGYQPLLHRVSGTLRFDIDQDGGGAQTWYVKIDHGNLMVSREDGTGAGDHRSGAPSHSADCVLSGHESEFERILAGQDSFAAAFVRGAITVQGDHTLAQNIRRFSPPAGLAEQPGVRQHKPTDERAPTTKRRTTRNQTRSTTRPNQVEKSENESWPTTKQ